MCNHLGAEISEMPASLPYMGKSEKGSGLTWHHASVKNCSKKESCDLVLRVTYIPLVSIRAVGAPMLWLQDCLLDA